MNAAEYRFFEFADVRVDLDEVQMMGDDKGTPKTYSFILRGATRVQIPEVIWRKMRKAWRARAAELGRPYEEKC